MSIDNRRGIPRRTLLATGLSITLPLAGCAGGNAETNVDNSQALRLTLETARTLRASYSKAVNNDAHPSANETLSMMRANHQEHVETLAKMLGESATAEAKPLDGDLDEGALDTLREGESKAHEEALDSCTNAPQQYAVLLGEITASRFGHIDALEDLN